jgi:hypothetical protein
MRWRTEVCKGVTFVALSGTVLSKKVTIITYWGAKSRHCRRASRPRKTASEFIGRESRQMATGNLALGQEQGESIARPRIVNDFSIIVATVNGSGSQSANSVLLKSIFGMGVPVSGKNLFPSNIAGLPTWYTIRASKDGYVARKREIDVLVALNPETARDDMMSCPAGRRGHLRRKPEPEAVSRRRGLLPGALRQDHRNRYAPKPSCASW